MHVRLLEAGDRLLAGMSASASRHAEAFLRRMGVEVTTGAKVTGYRNNRVILADGTAIPTRALIWVSGVRAESIPGLDPALIGRGGRIRVDAFNRVEGLGNVFAIGDQCLMTTDPSYPDGHPQLAQVAIQQSRRLADNLLLAEQGRPMRPFRYRNLGVMATIGRNRAVADFARVAHPRLGGLDHLAGGSPALDPRGEKQTIRAPELGLELLHLRPVASHDRIRPPAPQPPQPPGRLCRFRIHNRCRSLGDRLRQRGRPPTGGALNGRDVSVYTSDLSDNSTT